MLDGVAQWLKMLAKKRNLNLLAKSLTWEMFQVVLGGPVASRLLLHHGQRRLPENVVFSLIFLIWPNLVPS